MGLKQNLIAAKALITDRSNWGQESFARDANGEDINTLSEHAKCYCALGAVAKVNGIDISNENSNEEINKLSVFIDASAAKLWKQKVSQEEIDSYGYATIVELNDGEYMIPDMHPHEAVLAVFDIAIEDAAD